MVWFPNMSDLAQCHSVSWGANLPVPPCSHPSLMSDLAVISFKENELSWYNEKLTSCYTSDPFIFYRISQNWTNLSCGQKTTRHKTWEVARVQQRPPGDHSCPSAISSDVTQRHALSSSQPTTQCQAAQIQRGSPETLTDTKPLERPTNISTSRCFFPVCNSKLTCSTPVSNPTGMGNSLVDPCILAQAKAMHSPNTLNHCSFLFPWNFLQCQNAKTPF